MPLGSVPGPVACTWWPVVAPQTTYACGIAGAADLDSSDEVVWQQRSVVVHRHLQQQAVTSAVKLTGLFLSRQTMMPPCIAWKLPP